MNAGSIKAVALGLLTIAALVYAVLYPEGEKEASVAPAPEEQAA